MTEQKENKEVIENVVVPNNNKAARQYQIQMNAVRTSLINTAFQHYQQLIQFLKSLPINQATPGMQQGYLFIDSGMLWVKEMINTSVLNLNESKPEKKEEEKSIESNAKELEPQENKPEKVQNSEEEKIPESKL